MRLDTYSAVGFDRGAGRASEALWLALSGVLADGRICHGLMPRREVVGFLARMTGLLGTPMKRIGGLDYCLVSKSFEYLASGKPTLVVVCFGAQLRFYQEVGGAVLLDPDDTRAAATHIQQLAGKQKKIPISKAAQKTYR